MLSRVVSAAFFGILVVGPNAGQAQDSDSQTLHQILLELRGLREDMRVSESTQLLVAELGMQQDVVNRATQNADNARMKLNDIHADQKHVAAQLEHAEDQLEKASTADERNAVAQDIDRNKSNLAGMKIVEREWTTTLQDMQQRLQIAEDKLAGIESELSAAITRLGPVPKDKPQR